MLTSLYIKNIALIKELTVNLDEKLNIFSGETGAGKSIIIDSINFMLGAKTDKGLIRHGEETAKVEGVFDVGERADVKEKLAELDMEEDDVLIISRTMSTSGKNEIRLNGKLITLSMLREISHKLVDVHGQSEHFMLAKTSTHIELLDKFGKESILPVRNRFNQIYDKYVSLVSELNSFGGNKAERERMIDLYKFQIAEIEEANLQENEEEELVARFALLGNAEKIATALSGAISALSSEEGAISALSTSFSELNYISNLDEKFRALCERLKSVQYECDDINATLEDTAESLNFDERETDRVAERLEKIKSLKRKYGKDYKEITAFFEKTSAELERLERCDEEIERINGEIKIAYANLIAVGEKLTQERKRVAVIFGEKITAELKELGMENATFEATFANGDFESMLSRNGADSVEFMFSANLGEPKKPLVKVISGGEMSRFMLGLKSITADLDNIDTMIFDEIDTGISGKIAHVVAEKFVKLSKRHQIIVITHLPQIGASGDSNFLIVKSAVDGHTYTNITKLTKKEKLIEIARLAGSRELTENALTSANELISEYDKLKK